MKREMKRIGKMAAAIALIGFASCQKQSQTENTESVEDVVNTSRTAEATSTEELYSSTGCSYDWPSMIGDCAVVTESSTDFPKTVTIDYGDGCVGPYGRTKKGKIMINISDDIRNEGATREVTFDNFYIEEAHIEGSRTATNIGLSTSGNILISVDGSFTATTDAGVRKRTFSRQREWIQGSSTCDHSDDEFLITGGGTTTGIKGYEITHTIVDPLHVAPGSCEYILSGSVEVTHGKRGGTIDWGDGSCDNMATLTTKRGKTYDINLDERKILH